MLGIIPTVTVLDMLTVDDEAPLTLDDAIHELQALEQQDDRT